MRVWQRSCLKLYTIICFLISKCLVKPILTRLICWKHKWLWNRWPSFLLKSLLKFRCILCSWLIIVRRGSMIMGLLHSLKKLIFYQICLIYRYISFVLETLCVLHEIPLAWWKHFGHPLRLHELVPLLNLSWVKLRRLLTHTFWYNGRSWCVSRVIRLLRNFSFLLWLNDLDSCFLRGLLCRLHLVVIIRENRILNLLHCWFLAVLRIQYQRWKHSFLFPRLFNQQGP